MPLVPGVRLRNRELDREVADALADAWVECWSEYKRDFVHDSSVREDAGRHACELSSIANRAGSLDLAGDLVTLASAVAMLHEIG